MGQIGRRAGGLALLVLTGAGTLSGCGHAPAATASTLTQAAAVTVRTPAGTTVTGHAGMALAPGDEVIVGRHGWAVVTTGARRDDLLAGSALTVVDGARQTLQHGEVVVDARRGPALAARMTGYDVNVPAGSVVRINRGGSTGVAALAGTAEITSSGGARLHLPALSQTALGGDALPTTAAVAHLADDRAEAAAVPALVRADELLSDLARGIDRTGASTARAVDASWQTSASAGESRGTRRSDRVLPVVLARATSAPIASYRSALRWRAAGGSWGVIAALLDVSPDAAATELAGLQAAPGGIGRVVTAALAGRGPSQSPTAPQRSTVGGGSGSTATGNGSGPGGSGGAPSPPPATSPPPGGSGGGVGKVVGTVTKTVHQVLKHLPLPSPLASSLSSSLP